MPSDSPDFEALLLSEIAHALRGASLEAIVVGNVASMLLHPGGHLVRPDSLGSLKVADLADVIRSKEAAGRPKDFAALPILRDALSVKRALKR